ncbi:GTPase [Aquimarina sediminis]|uniref:GTPase n=1 Tax=Aquimarina sediminis TaxID=2070536 RepID=UPI000CA07659|nr:GTPase [Aquimarina sediminis]
MKKKLLFVYNTKSGILNKYLDGIHKIVSPNTYSCSLCGLTHGRFSEKEAWKNYRENADFEFEFMYKNMFLQKYTNEVYNNLSFPVVLQKKENEAVVFLDSKELMSLRSIEELIEVLKK